MCPLGMHGRTKKVSDILGAARIPVAERSLVPVVRTAPAGTIVWVAGVRLDERFKCTPATRFAIKLRCAGWCSAGFALYGFKRRHCAALRGAKEDYAGKIELFA